MFPSIGFSLGASQKSKATTSGFEVYEHSYFGGSWTAVDRAAVDARGAIVSQNVRFFGKSVETRYGWGVAMSIPAGEVGINSGYNAFNWLSELGNYLVWNNNSTNAALRGIRGFKVSDNPPVPTLLYNAANVGIGATYATAGPRLYTALWALDSQSNIVSTSPPACISISSGVFHADPLFPGPPSTTLVPATPPTEPGAGSVTAGLHYIGLRMLHRSGFLGRPGPDSSTTANPTPQTFVPIQFTTSGGKNLNWAFTPGTTWPIDVVQVQLVMSPVNNPQRFFEVPGAVQTVVGGVATPVGITFDISDDALVSGAAALECTDSLNFYTASATNDAGTRISVTAVAHIGNRMFYVSTQNDANGNKFSVIFASDLGQFQQISLSQHMLELPNQLKITQVIGIQGAINIIGPHWTYVTQDTGGVPVTWPSPSIVDGRKGALFPNCIEVNTQGKYAWIGDKTGLYYFDGAYSDLPVSWQNKDIWDQIGFPQAELTIKDDPLRHRVLVLASITNLFTDKLLVWDYTQGIDPYSVRFSRQDIPGGLWSGVGSIEIVQNDLFGSPTNATKDPELWFTPGVYDNLTVAGFWREKDPSHDATPYSDDADIRRAIVPRYDTCIFPAPGGDDDYLSFQGAKLRVTGSGPLIPQVFGFDGGSVIFLTSGINLSTILDAKTLFRGYFVQPNGFFFRFTQSQVDNHFVLSGIAMYYSRFGSVI